MLRIRNIRLVGLQTASRFIATIYFLKVSSRMNPSKCIKNRSQQSGFTLLELLMVIAVIGILATIAVPRMQNYSAQARFTEVINAAAPYKLAVERCLMERAAADCDAGSNGIPAGYTTAQGHVASVGVVDGAITAAGVPADFPNAATNGNTKTTTNNDNANNATTGPTYTLTPTPNANGVTWAVTGSCQTANLCN